MIREILALLVVVAPAAASAQDYDADGLEDADERARGTLVDDADSDRDGIPDGAEVLLGRPVTSLDDDGGGGGDASAAPRESRYTDPLRPTLLVEIDCDPGTCPSVGALRLAQRSFEAIDVEAYFFVDDPGEWLTGGASRDQAALEEALLASDDASNSTSGAVPSGAFAPYVHALFTDRGPGGPGDQNLGQTHSVVPQRGLAPTPADLGRAGVLVYSGEIARQHAAHGEAFAELGVTLDMLVARALVHELGHALGASHEGPPNGGVDWSNVMVASSDLGAPEDYPHHWQLQMVQGHPRFSAASRAQLHLDFKTSVETALPLLDRRFVVATPPLEVAGGYVAVLPTQGLEWGTGYGFDLHRGGFTVAHAGSGPWRVSLAVGATAPGEGLRCELGEGGPVVDLVAEPGGLGLLDGSAGGESGERVLVRPRVVENALGHGRSTFNLRCEAVPPEGSPVRWHWIQVVQEES